MPSSTGLVTFWQHNHRHPCVGPATAPGCWAVFSCPAAHGHPARGPAPSQGPLTLWRPCFALLCCFMKQRHTMVSLVSINRTRAGENLQPAEVLSGGGGDPRLQLESDAAPDTAEVLVTPWLFPAERGISSVDQLSTLTSFISLSRKAAASKAAISTALFSKPGDPGWAPALHFPGSYLFGFQGRSLPHSSKKDQNKEASFVTNKIYPIFIAVYTHSGISYGERMLLSLTFGAGVRRLLADKKIAGVNRPQPSSLAVWEQSSGQVPTAVLSPCDAEWTSKISCRWEMSPLINDSCFE